ncbi:sigma-70 family RNA polymerase sigma factor [Microlunatus soli]|uniref:RNA polymerase sigma-70 factor, ECF subfamily n=1 Tax=Microlunatus soli TaxID=630515 RepID=A0A1H2A425_9ACTN|nr:sigma-70 family RNA polymerase sigma factor [Microlunatus soli]SDT40669.1 RNA polymerase sigma-70 factor, ECF subfamily [Microlunatus soli]
MDLPRSDEDQLRDLFDQHAAALLHFVVPLTDGDRGRAEDIVQETLLRAWQHPAALKPDRGPSRRWLYTVARNLAVDAYRARTARPREISETALRPLSSPADDIDQALESWAVAEALAVLSEDHRRVLIELYYNAHSVAETATILRIPVGTVKSRSHYALQALRLVCEERGLLP